MEGTALGKRGLVLVGAGAVLVLVGFVLMSGGGAAEAGAYSEAVFSKARIVVAPLTALVGYVVVGVGILWKGR
jgi:NADH:ubiquinone oxidoreductase subunit 6 (subunit J)